MHNGHRERLRHRLAVEGTDGFEDHQLLEALLFYSIPRRDTNEIAHKLIERFGSISAVFSASSEELMMVEGIGENSATLIKLINGINRRLSRPDSNRNICYDSIGKIGQYLVNLYVGVSVERVYLLMFDNSMRLIDCAHICDGTINAAVMLPRTMAERALFKHASAVVVAHNHPHGLSVPSGDDINTTRSLRAAFDLIGVQMLEHIIVAGKNYSPIMRSRNMNCRGGEVTSFGSSDLYDHFYDDCPLPLTDADQPTETIDTK